jgi:hypothetical protein
METSDVHIEGLNGIIHGDHWMGLTEESDLAGLKWTATGDKFVAFKDDPVAMASIRWQLQRYVDAGSPELISEGVARIRRQLAMIEFLGYDYANEPRYDTPGGCGDRRLY